MLKAPAASAAAKASSAAKRPASARAVETCVPLMRESPSLGAKLMGVKPASTSPSRALKSTPWWRTSPTPMRTPERWARGAKSPEAPTEPCDGTRG